MRDAVSLQRDVALEVQQHARRRAGTRWITVKWCPLRSEGHPISIKEGIVAIRPVRQFAGLRSSRRGACRTDRHGDQLCQRAGKITLVNDRLVHPRDQSRFSGGNLLTVDRIPERKRFQPVMPGP